MGNITHTKISTIPDDPSYDILPSDWNAAHVIPDSIPNLTTTATSDMIFGAAGAWAKKTLAEAKILLGIPLSTANNDFMAGLSGAWVKKTLAETKTILNVNVKKIRGTVSNPQAVYAQRAQIPIMRADAALTITRIHIVGPDTSPGAELAGDLKYADDQVTGSFANAVVIDVCDTTNGVFTATSGFDDATVPSGKWIYFSMDASPHADWKDFSIEIFYTYDD